MLLELDMCSIYFIASVYDFSVLLVQLFLQIGFLCGFSVFGFVGVLVYSLSIYLESNKNCNMPRCG
jgi:hypothetical protein